MKVIGLDGKSYVWTPKPIKTSKRSNLHLSARQLITERWPANPVVEEVSLPGTNLYADFFVFGPKILIEVHGEQHYQFNNFYHKSKRDFILQQRNDALKQEWCELNNIKYIELPYRESPDEWRARLYG